MKHSDFFYWGLLAVSLCLQPAHAQEQPKLGDACAAWINCGPAASATGVYPDCSCESIATVEPTCEADSACRFPYQSSGTWPACSCQIPPDPLPKECGDGYLLLGGFCVPIIVKD